jgi:hypothetical protein
MGDVQRQENPLDRHEPNALVADTAQLRLIRNILRGLIEKEEPDNRLGLTLLSLTSADRAADAVLETQPSVLEERPDLLKPPSEWTGVDRLLENLRAVFKYDYGWTPTMGKNRVMTPVQAVTYPNAGGAGGPEPISLDALLKADKKRAQHPDAGRGVRVGLPDTVFYPHDTLTGKYVLSEPVDEQIVQADGKNSLPYITGHCTQVASLILREAPSARLDIRPVLALPENAERDPDRSVWDVARRMVGYLDSGVQIINCSWACLTWNGEPPLVLERAVGMLTPTIMVVAAASNHGMLVASDDDHDRGAADKQRREKRLPERSSPAFPAALPNVVAVGALHGELRATFNPVVRMDGNLGAEELAPWIDVLAQGVDTVGAYFGSKSEPKVVDVPVMPRKGQVAADERLLQKEFEGAAKWTGTSFAAAAVTAAVAARIQPGTSAHEALENLLDEDDSPIRRAHD